MKVTRNGSRLSLRGDIGSGDAEALVGHLQSGEVREVELVQCSHVHAAAVQALLAFGVRVEGAVEDAFLRGILMPAMAEATRDIQGRMD